MKQIPWDFFAQRRNISYASFKNMSYEQYTRWCARRNIIPLEESVFQMKVNPPPAIVKEVSPPVTKQPVVKVDTRTLPKKKKSELVALCDVMNVEITGKETKKQLIALLAEQSQ